MKNRIKEGKKEQFIILPVWFIRLTSDKRSSIYLTPFERGLFCLIRGLCNPMECYANDQYFANLFKVSIKHVNKSIHKLEYLGFLRILHINNKRFIEIGQIIEKGSAFINFSKENDKVNITTENEVKEMSLTEWEKMSEKETGSFLSGENGN